MGSRRELSCAVRGEHKQITHTETEPQAPELSLYSL